MEPSTSYSSPSAAVAASSSSGDEADLFVGGISRETTRYWLVQYFSKYGKVAWAKVIENKITGGNSNNRDGNDALKNGRRRFAPRRSIPKTDDRIVERAFRLSSTLRRSISHRKNTRVDVLRHVWGPRRPPVRGRFTPAGSKEGTAHSHTSNTGRRSYPS